MSTLYTIPHARTTTTRIEAIRMWYLSQVIFPKNCFAKAHQMCSRKIKTQVNCFKIRTKKFDDLKEFFQQQNYITHPKKWRYELSNKKLLYVYLFNLELVNKVVCVILTLFNIQFPYSYIIIMQRIWLNFFSKRSMKQCTKIGKKVEETLQLSLLDFALRTQK